MVFCRLDGGLVCIYIVVVRFYILPHCVLDFEEVLNGKGALVVQDVEFGLVSVAFKIAVDASKDSIMLPSSVDLIARNIIEFNL
jgi:hypothetical protein